VNSSVNKGASRTQRPARQ